MSGLAQALAVAALVFAAEIFTVDQTVGPALSLSDPALLAARTALAQGQWPAAELQLRAYLRDRPASAIALYLLAETLQRENKSRDSLETFTRAAALAAPSALQLRFVAMDYVLLNDYPDAEKWIRISLQQNPQDGESWYMLGRILQTDNRFADAVTAFTRSLQLMPRSVKVEDNLGLAEEGLNQPDRAIATYRQALAWQADAPHPSEQPFLNLGTLLTDRNQLQEALPLLQRAEALAPRDPRIHTALGRLYVRLQQYPQAQTELEQAVAAQPDNASLHFQLGQVYRKVGNIDRSTRELTRAAALEAEHRR